MSASRAATRPAARRVVVLIALAALGLLGGCAGGGVELRYWLIDAVELDRVRADDAPLSVQIVDLDVPQYLERFQLARRGGDNRIVYDANDQWGEPLRENLLRTLAGNLTAALGTVDVSSPLNRLASRADIAVRVHVERFEPDADGMLRLEAHWQVIDPAAGVPLATERAAIERRVGGEGPAAQVAAMQGVFAELSARIARSLRVGAESES